MSRIGFFDPYLEVLGGGEKYLLTILELAVGVPGAEVTVFSPVRPDPGRWRRLNVHVEAGGFRWRRAGPVGVTPMTRGLDLFVALANHVPPFTLARRSAAVIQFPFVDLRDPAPLPGFAAPVRALERRLRLARYDPVLCYSRFVRDALVARLGIADPVVVHPPVDLPGRVREDKGPAIVAVGRFFPAADGNNKKHDVLIEAFRRLQTHAGAREWTLHLAGGLHDDPGSHAYLKALQAAAEGLAVRFHPNAGAGELAELYAGASLFWHAAGHGETRPERHEHFGITTVEAMGHGCVPVVPALGGQLEIVRDGVNGRLWRTLDELVEVTLRLIDRPSERADLRSAALRDAPAYSRRDFDERINALLLDPLRG